MRDWHVLFPTFTPASDILTELRRKIREKGIEVHLSTEVESFTAQQVELTDGRTLTCDAVVVATGFALFDARIKEEYGYGIYDKVITSADWNGFSTRGKLPKPRASIRAASPFCTAWGRATKRSANNTARGSAA